MKAPGGSFNGGGGRFTLPGTGRSYLMGGNSCNLGSEIGSCNRKRTFMKKPGKSNTFFSSEYWSNINFLVLLLVLLLYGC